SVSGTPQGPTPVLGGASTPASAPPEPPVPPPLPPVAVTPPSAGGLSLPSLPTSLGSAQAPLAHTCPVGQSVAALVQLLWHSRSMAQMSGCWQAPVAGQRFSSSSWQTLPPGALRQRAPSGQSRVSIQATWHLPKVQASGLLHSLFTIQVLPAGGVLEELQPTARPTTRPNVTATDSLDMARIISASRGRLEAGRFQSRTLTEPGQPGPLAERADQAGNRPAIRCRLPGD